MSKERRKLRKAARKKKKELKGLSIQDLTPKLFAIFKSNINSIRAEIMIEFLESISPEKCCDDCISKETGIKPRQRVNRICRLLNSAKVLARERGSCLLCNRRRLVGTISVKQARPQKLVKRISSMRPISENDVEEPKSSLVIQPLLSISNMTDIVYACNEIENMCGRLWQRASSSRSPKFGTPLINRMKNEEILPRHQANMMLTLYNLRNAVMHNDLKLGANETQIANAAWAIVREWWEQYWVRSI
jgi:hypothetical protein